MKHQHLFAATLVTLSLLLSGCGGGSAPPVPQAPPAQPHIEPPPRFDYFKHFNKCAVPRTGLDPYGFAYPDMPGSLEDEILYLRGWLNEGYLWYRELPDPDPDTFHSAIEYFNVLKTPALTAAGKPKDRYHFTYETARWDALQYSGVELGYGITWVRNTGVPREWRVAVVEPGSPSDLAGIRRGDRLVRIDGIDFIGATDAALVARINEGLTPHAAGEVHAFAFARAGVAIEAPLAAVRVSVDPVRNAQVFDTTAGKIGYLTFGSHNNVSERMLADAFTGFRDAGVTDLVLDVRYNGGGLLYVASELAYMVAGPAATAGKVFERPVYNDHTPVQPFIPFLSKAVGYSAPTPIKAGTPLPTLGLRRVTLLTGGGTCSASESVINSLRGVDVEVILVGGQTCGKPYAFTPVSNCGTTYFAIEFQGVNDKGFGDYGDGFAPTCAASDDLAHQLGDPAEGLLATALQRLATQSCPVQATTLREQLRQLVPAREPVHEIAIREGGRRR
jgi:carboxyl-terminal processing protease